MLNRLKDYYVQQDNQTQGESLFYDIGQFLIYADNVAASVSLGKLMVSYTVHLYQPVAQTELGEFNSYNSVGLTNNQPFQTIETQGMEESLKIMSTTQLQAVRPGIYTIDVFGSGTTTNPSSFSIGVINSALSTVLNSVSTSNSSYRSIWTVTLA